MKKEEKLDLLADAFDVDVSDLQSDVELENMDNWDSMTKLSLVSLMDEKFKKVLTKDIISKFKRVQDILDFMEQPLEKC